MPIEIPESLAASGKTAPPTKVAMAWAQLRNL
ncbi:hypothetical protein M2244_000917 [Rhodoferax antarcticus]|nr:hypothetical protein [Rhodoferax antarcticus]